MGWTIPDGGADAYANWADGKTFVAGDALLFNFTTGEQDVLRVPKASFDACSDSDPIGDAITNGPVNINLDAAGDYYYICTFSQHCQFGQKLAVSVSVSASPPPSTPTEHRKRRRAQPTTPTTPTKHRNPRKMGRQARIH